jgi:alcohol dehydrogenase YqhD (iron-dependent ADH family)
VRVWNVEMDVFNPEAVARNGIEKMEAFFHSLGLGTKLADLGIKDNRIAEMADKCTGGDTRTVGNFVKLDREAVRKILLLAQ